jgi:two-component system sensor histidine kinase PilS (NtrC family)
MKKTELPTGNRRRGDRRRGERRQVEQAAAIDESWFAALGVAVDTQLEDEVAAEAESRLGGWREQHEHPAPPDSRFISRQALRLISGTGSAFQRIYRTFVTARAALGIALVLAQIVGALFGVHASVVPLLLCVAYATQAVVLWLLPRFRAPATPRALARLRSPQWIGTIGMDLLSFSALHLLEPGSNFNYVALLVLPVLMAGVLTPRLMALGTAAAIALMLLGGAWHVGLSGTEMTAPMTQAGLAGIGFFVITLLAGELAGRLAREELTARGSLELARQQAQLNRLVIEQMQDGVMVVDRRSRVRIANPAARLLLGAQSMCRPAPFALHETRAWRQLDEAVQRAFNEGAWPEAGREVVLPFEPGLSRTLVVRVRFTRRLSSPGEARQEQGGEDLCVLFLEDLRSVQARTRQEKLAAMGRVSAGIAHEIRNPLAAIAQANALLAEDAQTHDQQQLTRMVTENVERLKRIIDDVMEVAPGTPPTLRVIDATAEVERIAREWAHTGGLTLGPGSRLTIELPAQPLGVVFEPDHLRRVLINLLDNGRRHGSETAGAVSLSLAADDARTATLCVASDSPPIPPEVERHLFEPFFSTRSRGTGLGLYICKELCERYGATIDYRPGPADERHRNIFCVTMKRANIAAP